MRPAPDGYVVNDELAAGLEGSDLSLERIQLHVRRVTHHQQGLIRRQASAKLGQEAERPHCIEGIRIDEIAAQAA